MKTINFIGFLMFFYSLSYAQNDPERIAIESGNNADLYIQKMDDFYKNREVLSSAIPIKRCCSKKVH